MKMKTTRSFARLAWVMLLLLTSVCAMAQKTVKGTVLDKDTSEPIIGAAVIVDGTTNGTVTDFDGNFSLNVDAIPVNLSVSFLGYTSQIVNATSPSVGVIKLATDSKTLEDVVVTSSIAVSRKTPVALSSISPELIEEKLSTQEFPEILKSTPGVHANKQGGGYGDSEIYMRGFDNTNIATMINGVPMNDMENGTVYWSNWAGLSDVTASMQTQRGLGASKVSSPSVGGTINVVTKGIEAKKGGVVSYAIGSNNANKILVSFSTGLLPGGWAISALGAKSWGNGLGQGMDYEDYNYFFNISKRINDRHQLSFTAFGSPQHHYKRSNGLTLKWWKTVEYKYGVKDYKYNPDYGFDKNGQRKASDYNVYHKPQLSLNHQWQITDKSSLSTAVYASLGRGYGYAGEANGNIGSYSYNDFKGAYYGELQTKFRKVDGTFDYGAMQDINEASEHGSAYVMTKSMNSHNWVGLLSTYTTNFLNCIDFYGGVDFRYYEGEHTNEICDLMGGEYFIDADRSKVLVANNKNASDANWVNKKLKVGDVCYRDYTGHVIQGGAFFQGEYNKDNLSAFVAGSLSSTSYWRYDRLYYDKDHAKSDVMNYMGGTIKAGANYNINAHHNVFVNLGYISRAPKFSYGAFMSATTSHATNPDAKNEKIASFELGYGYKNRLIDARLNAYYTRWMDKAMTKSGTLDSQAEYYMNMTGVDALHKGVEVEVKAPLADWVTLNGMFSYGDWQWDSNATGYAYDEHGQALTAKGVVTTIGSADHAWSTINLKGIRVGGSAQTTAALGATFKVDAFKIGADWTLTARNYSYYSFSGSNLSLGSALDVADPWKIPHASTLDANASYRFDFGSIKATLYANVNNVLNYHYITKAYNPQSLKTAASEDNIYCFLDMGRTCNIRLKLSF